MLLLIILIVVEIFIVVVVVGSVVLIIVVLCDTLEKLVLTLSEIFFFLRIITIIVFKVALVRTVVR